MTPRHRHYRAPTKPLLTAWARHLDAVMRDRDLSQTNVFDEVREELGYATTSRSAIVRVFSDKEPDARQAEVLARHYGQPAPLPIEEPGPSADVTGLVAAMTAALLAQTTALTDLRADLAQARDDAREERSAMTKMLADLGDELEALRGSVGRGAGAAAPHQAAGR